MPLSCLNSFLNLFLSLPVDSAAIPSASVTCNGSFICNAILHQSFTYPSSGDTFLKSS